MKNFKTKDLMITINPGRSASNALYNCDEHTKTDTTGCTTCTHVTTTDGTECTTCTHNTTTEGTQCTTCTHNTTPTCIPHTKPGNQHQINESVKAIELTNLKKTIAQLQQEEYA